MIMILIIVINTIIIKDMKFIFELEYYDYY